MADIPHLTWPFAMGHRQLRVVEQDSIEDVQQNVHSYLATERGERPLSPDFGLEDPTFAPGVDTAAVAGEIMESEDRAEVTITTTGPNAQGQMDVAVNVELAE